MALRTYTPVTPTQRHKVSPSFDTITTDKPLKSLTKPLRSTGGRNNQGRMTVRHRGGGHKRRYRIIDFKRNKHDIPAKVATIEYDPNRSARIALLYYVDGEKRYILAPLGLKVGDLLQSGSGSPFKVGNSLPLGEMPAGAQVHNVELKPGKGGQLVRSAGSSAQLMAKEGTFVLLKLPSGEVRKVPKRCYATLGAVSNPEHGNIVLGKAGASRWRGRRPSVRGVAMNPVDHPMGGGEGKTSGGGHPRSRTGKLAKGGRTRRKHLQSDNLIVRRRTAKSRA